MPRDPREFEDAVDEFRDDEYPEEDDSDDDLTETTSCPDASRAEIYEDRASVPRLRKLRNLQLQCLVRPVPVVDSPGTVRAGRDDAGLVRPHPPVNHFAPTAGS